MAEWIGPHGVPSSIRPGSWADIDRLERRGCGAWYGNGICGQVPVQRVFGGTDLMFATYVSANEQATGRVHAFLCDRHHPGDGAINGRLIADMRADILQSQRRKMTEFFRRSGKRMSKPNLLFPDSTEPGGAREPVPVSPYLSAEPGTYLVLYANSHEQARVTGRLMAGHVPRDGPFMVAAELAEGCFVQGRWIASGEVLVMDPRCVIWDAQERMVYNPREHVAKMDRGLRRWMDEHPRWPPKRPPHP